MSKRAKVGLSAKIVQHGTDVFEVFLSIPGHMPWTLHKSLPSLKKAESHLKACGNRKCVYTLEQA